MWQSSTNFKTVSKISIFDCKVLLKTNTLLLELEIYADLRCSSGVARCSKHSQYWDPDECFDDVKG